MWVAFTLGDALGCRHQPWPRSNLGHDKVQKGSHDDWTHGACRYVGVVRLSFSIIGTLAWNDHVLTSGSRDRLIYHRDVRCQEHFMKRLSGHKQEVCGLKWSHDGQQLASGGNDNRLLLWDKHEETPTFKLTNHTAAVKAISWSPHQARSTLPLTFSLFRYRYAF